MFTLNRKFVERYKDKEAPFGFNGLGYLVYKRTYSRIKEDGTNEEWVDTVERVVNGTFNMQLDHMGKDFDWKKSNIAAEDMFDRIFNMKFLPPGRGLWAMGSPLTESRGLFTALNNCAFISTDPGDDDLFSLSFPYTFLMEASLLGVGVGFDTKGAGRFDIQNLTNRSLTHTIEDSREAWVESVRALLDSYFVTGTHINFVYDKIRKKGTPIKGLGGVAAGPDILKNMHECLRKVLDKNRGSTITVRTIVDIMNIIGAGVISGGVRRSAEIAFGVDGDYEFASLKDYKENPDRAAFGWASNNSIMADFDTDYTKYAERIIANGEPGFLWLDNMREFSRMNVSTGDFKDEKVLGANPCVEQSLEDGEVCTLVESFPNSHESLLDYCATLRSAFLYAKTVTLGSTLWEKTNKIIERNRRIGTSMSGIAQFITKRGLEELRTWCNLGYAAIEIADYEYSEMFNINRSIKKTSIKPSGSVSLLAGATPGLHYPESRYYIRRLRVSDNSDLLPLLKEANYFMEPDKYVDNTIVVEIPIDAGEGIRSAGDLSMWEQLSLAAFMQEHWSDNQVSATITFNPETEGKDIPAALNYFQFKLKGVSFLARAEQGVYEQSPYEAIDEAKFLEISNSISRINYNTKMHRSLDPDQERFCDNETCMLSSVL